MDSFAALPGVIYRNMDAPKLKSVRGGISPDAGTGKTYSGYVTVTFDKTIRWKPERVNGAAYTGDPYTIIEGSSRDDTNKTVGLLNRFTPSNANISVDMVGSDTFTIEFNSASVGDITLLTDGTIVGSNGNTDNNDLVISVVDRTTNETLNLHDIHVEVSFDRTLQTASYQP